MGKVLLLGAGASWAHGVDSGLRPPLANGFFAGADAYRIRHTYSALFQYLEAVHGVDTSPNSRANIEAVFGAVQHRWERLSVSYDGEEVAQTYGEHFRYVSPYDMLRSFVVETVVHGTQWLDQRTCPLHDCLAHHWLSPGDVVISFNYDVIIDASLLRTNKWNEAVGYGFIPSANSWIKDDLRRMGDYSSPVTLLKPHGSVNWFRSSLRTPKISLFPNVAGNSEPETEIKDAINIVRVFDAMAGENSAKNTSPIRYAAHITGFYEELERTLRKNAPAELWRLKGPQSLVTDWAEKELPLVVLPTPFKSAAQMTFAELAKVWQKVDAALEGSSEVLACGFSFSDPHFSQAMVEAGVRRRRPISLKIIFGGSEYEYQAMVDRIASKHVVIAPRYQGWLRDFVREPQARLPHN